MTTANFYDHIDSPIGPLLLISDGNFITGLYTSRHKRVPQIDASWRKSDAPFEAIRLQLAEYFAGERQQFDLPLKLIGTPFQRRVWQELVRIPFGKTINYGQLACRVGNANASRAVGHANGRNPISIIVPCHRVIGASGSLTGYGGGLETKKQLLEFERGEPALIFSVASTQADDSCAQPR